MNEPPSGWLKDRAAGVLLHPTSLPGSMGIGTMDENAVAFLEFLASAGFKYWQICPLGPTGYGDSPYQCFSAFAGNPYLIDLAALVGFGLLAPSELAPLQLLGTGRVDFGKLYAVKWPVLFQAHARFVRGGRKIQPYGDFETFRESQSSWLPDYALYSALKGHFDGRPWWDWPQACRTPAARKGSLARELAERVEAYEFIQYLFFGQWTRLRSRAAALGLAIIGDTPIFAALDSADVWANPGLFQLNQKSGRPLAVAGCPPDYFSADGQLWGNPLYDWPKHAADGFKWWISRLKANFALFDVVRIDHFRGFEAYWSIPAGSVTARPGHWVPGPGMDFFRAVQGALPGLKLIAEDLGTLTPEVIALRDATGLPGMAVLQFAFGGPSDNFYLPHNHRANCVVYPGTHDNDTTLGWYATADEKTRDHVRRYFRVGGQEVHLDFLRAAYASVSALAVISLPDLLGLGSEARLNSPGVPDGNWSWRFTAEQLAALAKAVPYLREMAELYRR
ncbi:MAG: 4-alpha-glucanotransferase [Verrucomicrobia bacterium]|nr:4-alpha-glucanotransferase [Verrucomicrobiota bacterium]